MATDTSALTDKAIAAETLARMPETATLAEISERFAILAGIARGQREIDEGKGIPHDEADERSRSWVGK